MKNQWYQGNKTENEFRCLRCSFSGKRTELLKHIEKHKIKKVVKTIKPKAKKSQAKVK